MWVNPCSPTSSLELRGDSAPSAAGGTAASSQPAQAGAPEGARPARPAPSSRIRHSAADSRASSITRASRASTHTCQSRGPAEHLRPWRHPAAPPEARPPRAGDPGQQRHPAGAEPRRRCGRRGPRTLSGCAREPWASPPPRRRCRRNPSATSTRSAGSATRRTVTSVSTPSVPSDPTSARVRSKPFSGSRLCSA